MGQQVASRMRVHTRQLRLGMCERTHSTSAGRGLEERKSLVSNSIDLY